MTVRVPDVLAAGPASRRFGTGLLDTTVVAGPGGVEWFRSPGSLAPAPFVPVTSDVLHLLGSAPVSGTVGWAACEPDGPGRRYRTRGAWSIAGRLLREGPGDELVGAMDGLGRALRELHALPARGFEAGPSRGTDRLTTWLAGRSPSPRAAYAESLLRPRLGETRLAAVHALCERIATDDAVPAHGAPALGSLVPSDDGADMLVGEDLCRAPWYLDLGWVLGELVELRWYRGDDHPAWSAAVAALFAGYGRDLGAAWPLLAAFRVLLHLHDYTAYVGWDEPTFDRYTAFVRFLLDIGAERP